MHCQGILHCLDSGHPVQYTLAESMSFERFQDSTPAGLQLVFMTPCGL